METPRPRRPAGETGGAKQHGAPVGCRGQNKPSVEAMENKGPMVV